MGKGLKISLEYELTGSSQPDWFIQINTDLLRAFQRGVQERGIQLLCSVKNVALLHSFAC